MIKQSFFFLFLASQAAATDYTCSLRQSCVNTLPCETVDLDIKFTTNDKNTDPLSSLEPPPPAENFLTRVSGLEEEFEAFAIGDADSPVIGFFGHMRISEKILEPGYFAGKLHEQHLFTFANGIARYSIHKPMKNEALYLEGSCTKSSSE